VRRLADALALTLPERARLSDAPRGESAPPTSEPSSARPGHTPAINLSPAVARCIGVTDAATGIRVDWAFVDRPPTGPWTAVLTTRQADQDGRRP